MEVNEEILIPILKEEISTVFKHIPDDKSQRNPFLRNNIQNIYIDNNKRVHYCVVDIVYTRRDYIRNITKEEIKSSGFSTLSDIRYYIMSNYNITESDIDNYKIGIIHFEMRAIRPKGYEYLFNNGHRYKRFKHRSKKG